MRLRLSLYKNLSLISLLSAIIWLGFTFAAFKGFHFWYTGFVFFFWLSLATLNYKHETTLWIIKNRTHLFIKFFIVLLVMGFVADFIIGQHIAHLWSYPYYNTLTDWLRLYFIIYPFGGMCVLELTFFLSNFFREKFIFTHTTKNVSSKIIDASEHVLDILLLFLVVGLPLLYFFHIKLPFPHLFLYGFFLWVAVTTVRFTRHIRHGLHWFAITLTVLFLSVFLHEVPNTAVFEWKYHTAPILNPLILGILL